MEIHVMSINTQYQLGGSEPGRMFSNADIMKYTIN